MQGPGGADEDTTGGFSSGGWLVPFVDADFGAIVDSWFANTTVLSGDLIEQVQKLKQQPTAGELQIHGSWRWRKRCTRPASSTNTG